MTGLLKKTYGSRTYPVEYTYDAQGRMQTMKTWQDFADNEATATTTWNYNSYRGWLDNKRYPLPTGEGQGEGTDYTYTSAGRLKSRAWARGVTTWYTNNAAGDLSVVNYTDSTPDVTYTYDRRGRQITIAQSGGTTTSRTYNDASQLLRESYSGGPLSGVGVTNVYDLLLCHFAGENRPRSCGSKPATPRCLSSYQFWFSDQALLLRGKPATSRAETG